MSLCFGFAVGSTRLSYPIMYADGLAGMLYGVNMSIGKGSFLCCAPKSG